MNSITLYITGSCNLQCEYCFERNHNFFKGHITNEIIEKSINLLFEESDSQDLNISFFGGEPLLYPDSIIYACEYANNKALKKNKKINYTITSNITLIDDNIISLLKKYNIFVLASVDGFPKKSDVRYWNGTKISSCQTAFDNLFKLKNAEINVMIRWTVSKTSVIYLFEDCKKLIEYGFTNLGIEFVYEELWEKYDLDILEEVLGKISKLYIYKLREDYDIKIKPFEDAISLFKLDKRTSTRCGYGAFGLGIGADGDIQPCHRFVSRSDHEFWSFGNVLTHFDKEKRQKMIDDWNIDKIKVSDGRLCKDCPVKLKCPGGSCFPVNLDTCNDLYTTPNCYCDIQLSIQRVVNDIIGILYGEQNELLIKKLS